MWRAVKMIGIDAGRELVRASTDAGEGNCLKVETKVIDGKMCSLYLDFDSGQGIALNFFEGCCTAAGKFYAIEPKMKEDNDYEILKALGAKGYQQWWWYWTYDDKGNPDTLERVENVEVPIP